MINQVLLESNEATQGNRRFVFHCPGCECGHFFESPRWTFNGSMEKPTVSPSILVQSSYAGKETRCHSYVHDGQIQFLGDCTHKLAGQTVDLPVWEDS